MGSLRQLYLQQRLERRQVTAAAKIIQNAYRQHRVHLETRQKQLELEYKAAVIIQTYYRRYKEYRYSKKLHQAAALIQKKFRLYKSARRKCSPGCEEHELQNDLGTDKPLIQAFAEFLANSTADPDTCANDQAEDNVCSSSCTAGDELDNEKDQKAALLIQHAFRCHRKRQASAAGPATKRQRLYDHYAMQEGTE